MNSQLRRRLWLVGTLAVALGALAFIAFGGIGQNLVYYWNPTELIAAGESARGARVRLGGMVKQGSLSWTEGTQDLRFIVVDESSEFKVHSRGTPPEMFREGIGVLIEGTLGEGDVFEGERLLIKHSNEYRAPVDGKHPGDVYESVEGL